jgi:hypothetical protein
MRDASARLGPTRHTRTMAKREIVVSAVTRFGGVPRRAVAAR